MKKILTTLFALMLFSQIAYADDSMLDMDMDFIDNPFKNQKPVSEEQFDKTVQQLSTPRKGLIQKFKEFLGRNEPENDPALKNYKSDDLSNEMGLKMDDVYNKRPNIILAGPIMDSFGRIIPDGHYQVEFQNKDNVKSLNFIQGATTYGTIRVHDTTDSWEGNSIIYARVVYPSEEVAKIIFSNLDECVEGYAKIVQPES